MATLPTPEPEYLAFFASVKARIHSAQIKAAFAVNAALIELYWELGKLIAEKQLENSWGNHIIDQLAKDLKTEFPGIAGFSRANLFYIRKFYLFYTSEKVQQVIGLLPVSMPESASLLRLVTFLPWGHHITLLTKVKEPEAALFYLQQTLEHNWSRAILTLQIEQNLFGRQGKAITNFHTTLPQQQAFAAQQILKDPYNFDFLMLEAEVQEREIEKQLMQHITRFLLELGKGFAFIGRQYHVAIGDKDYYLDLLFYHIRLRCFVVIDLKAGEFKPEYAGKMNFYLSAVDDLLKTQVDQPSIGIILCKSKNRIEVEYALRDINKPMGVSEFKLTDALPADLKSSIPTVAEFEAELNKPEA